MFLASETVIDLEFVQANSKCYLKTSIILIPGEQSILSVPGTVKREASHVPVCALELYNCSGRHPLSLRKYINIFLKLVIDTLKINGKRVRVF